LRVKKKKESPKPKGPKSIKTNDIRNDRKRADAKTGGRLKRGEDDASGKAKSYISE